RFTWVSRRTKRRPLQGKTRVPVPLPETIRHIQCCEPVSSASVSNTLRGLKLRRRVTANRTFRSAQVEYMRRGSSTHGSRLNWRYTTQVRCQRQAKMYASTHIVVHYHELWLKLGNRLFFLHQ